MSIWGKLAAAELLIGGPIAALFGRVPPDEPGKKRERIEENDVAFTVRRDRARRQDGQGRWRRHQGRGQGVQRAHSKCLTRR